MVKIRLRRIGAKKAPFYRIVVADSRFARDGRFIEEIGYYDPTKEPSVVKIDADKAKEEWLANGAQPTDTVRVLLKKRPDRQRRLWTFPMKRFSLWRITPHRTRTLPAALTAADLCITPCAEAACGA